MLTILVGENTSDRTKRLEEFLSKAEDVRRYDDITFEPENLRVLSGSVSLFGGALSVSISHVEEDSLEGLLPGFVESPHAFFISLEKMSAPLIKKLEKAGATVETFKEATKKKKEEVFNVFSLTDAFSARDLKKTWGLYRVAIGKGLEPRELHSRIFWAIKTMIVAGDSSSPKESGLHPFVHQKSKKAAENFKEGELKSAALSMARLFHESMTGGKDMEALLEGFILRTLSK